MIKAEIVYAERELRSYFEFQLLKKSKIRYLYYGTAVMFAIGAIILLVGKTNYWLGIILGGIALILPFLFPLQVKGIVRKQTLDRYERPNQLITFSKKSIVQMIDGNPHAYEWDEIKEVNETSKYIYLQLTQFGALILSKQHFIEGTPEELIQLLKERKKHIIKYRTI